jgi:threonine/homoserine/homoserine lactone efflux protein
VIYVYALIFGIVVAFFGILLPGLLNMTAVSISVKSGKRAGLMFAGGMAVTTSFQAFIAFGSADYLRQNGEVLDQLRISPGVYHQRQIRPAHPYKSR